MSANLKLVYWCVVYQLMCWAFCCVYAQTARIDLPPLSGALERNYSGLFFASTTTGYVVTHKEVLHTIDGGGHWEMRATIDGRIQSSFFLDDSTAWLYVRAADFALYRTLDGFRTLQLMSTHFQRHDTGRVGTVAQVFFLDANRGWGAGGNHIAATTDGGQTWSAYLVPKALGTVGQVVMFSPTDGVARTDQGIIRTGDGGATWHAVAGAPRDTSDLQCAGQGMCILIDPVNTIQASTDGGTSWQVQTVPIDAGHIDHHDIVENVQVSSTSRVYVFGRDDHIPPVGQREIMRPDGTWYTPASPRTRHFWFVTMGSRGGVKTMTISP